ncbi:phosphoribosylamine--glycine ligase [Ereboglobus sp. PH5-5]|uniref:phosphoribosylamine--glycine ligase n=1 Tax=Ereboglobus sp. PH5-5 TaxID=2940529 RepID=UPI002406D197|nr:phosphoribosylamine--glycine ligase [Ereboglobus sp. PH5-5]MDF9833811.1 phosphoribosylamine--glycine ligase [Ereboglobus sp. PH5-5]
MPQTLPKSILVVGSGGREHAIVKSLLASPSKPRVVCAPGNAGIAGEIHCFPEVAADNIAGLVELAQREQIDFVVVGPEVPLSLGLVDALADANIPAYGPKADGARLEASKIYTKEILLKYKIPTAEAATFDNAPGAVEYLRTHPAPIVIKADGLAAGKGVVVAQTTAEAETAVHDLLALNAATASDQSKILIEACLTGEETSILVIVSGRDYYILPTSQDHKRIGDGDTGPNTGGMGTYSPAEVVTPELLARIDREIVSPSVNAIADEGIDFRGTLFIGIMLTPSGPQVLEYNTRFGDPETQVVLPRLDADLLALLWAAAKGNLAEVARDVRVRPEAAICVVVASKGYPGKFPKGIPITLPAALPPQTTIIHAGTARDKDNRLVTAGGRVLGVTSLAPTLAEAASRAYAACDEIECETKYCRRDIGAKQLNRK